MLNFIYMNVPKNHHYVSQSLSRNFMPQTGKMFKYNKNDNRIHDVNSTKSLFSRKFLNSKINDAGEIDHSSVESDLNQHFETHFPKHYKVLINAAYGDFEIGKFLPNSDEIEEAMEYIIGMALIGNARHPKRMEENHEAILGTFKTLAEIATPELKNEINEYLDKVAPVNNKTPVDFEDLKNKIRHYMGEVRFGLMRAPEDHYFILPDCSSTIKRFPVAPDVIDGETYYNPAMPIGLTLMPINSKLLIAATSRDLLSDGFEDEPSGFHDIDGALAMSYNRILFESAYNEIACENKEFLQKFVDSVSQ